MAKKRTKKIKLIPLLIGLIILTAIAGLFFRFFPFNQQDFVQAPASSNQSIADETTTALATYLDEPQNCYADILMGKIPPGGKWECTSYNCVGGGSNFKITKKIIEYQATTKENKDGTPFKSEFKRIGERQGEEVACPVGTQKCNTSLNSDIKGGACMAYTIAGGSATCPGGILDYPNYSLCLSNVTQNENGTPWLDKTVNYVKLTVKNIPAKSEESSKDAKDQNIYYYCLRTNPKDCDDDDIKNNKAEAKDGNIIIEKLCGDGPNKLKANDKCTTGGSDWFHQEKTYRVTFFEKPKVISPQAAEVSFYIPHMYPTVIEPKSSADGELNASFSLDALNAKKAIDVILEGRNPSPGENSNAQNAYWVRLVGLDNDYKSAEGCVYVPFGRERGQTALQLSPYLSPEGNKIADISAGNYFLQIKEGAELSTDKKSCKEGKFTYIHLPIRVGQGAEKAPNGTIIREAKPGYIGTPIKDPYRKEIGLQRPQVSPPPVCDFQDIDTATGYCKKIKTALGIKISTEPTAFVADLFSVVLMVGGIAAVVFIIQAGYTLMTSAGNKEKVGQAREQITSAILGLIFIILSIAILEFIGVNILHIPGLGN